MAISISWVPMRPECPGPYDPATLHPASSHSLLLHPPAFPRIKLHDVAHHTHDATFRVGYVRRVLTDNGSLFVTAASAISRSQSHGVSVRAVLAVTRSARLLTRDGFLAW